MNNTIRKISVLLLACFLMSIGAAQAQNLSRQSDDATAFYRLGYCDVIDPFTYGPIRVISIGRVAYGITLTPTRLSGFGGTSIAGAHVASQARIDNVELVLCQGNPKTSTPIAVKKNLVLQPGWNEICFDTPISIDPSQSYDLAIFFEQKKPSDLFMCVDKTSVVRDEAQMAGIQTSAGFIWRTMADSGMGNLLFQALVEGDVPRMYNQVRLLMLSVPGMVIEGQQTSADIYVENCSNKAVKELTLRLGMPGGDVATRKIAIDLPPNSRKRASIDKLTFAQPGSLKAIVAEVDGKANAQPLEKRTRLADIRLYKSGARPMPRTILAELFTSEGCDACGEAMNLTQKVLADLAAKGIAAASATHHTAFFSDPFTIEASEKLLPFFGASVPFGPSVLLDRRSYTFLDEFIIWPLPVQYIKNKQTLETLLYEAARFPSDMALSLKTEMLPGDVLSASFGIERTASLVGNDEETYYTLYIVEDQVPAIGQKNQKDFVHQGIVRTVLTPAGGKKIDLLNGRAEINERMYIDPSWRKEHLRVIAFVHKSIDKAKIADLEGNKPKHPMASAVYQCLQTAVGGSAKTSTSEVVADQSAPSFTIYTIGNAILVDGQYSSYSVYDLSGRVYPSSGLVPGVYIVRVDLPNGRFSTQKIVIR